MNICIVTQQYKNVFSGVGLHANNLTRALLAERHQITLLLPEDQAPELDLPNLTVVTVKKPRFSKSQARWISLSFSFNSALRELESHSKFDLIHFTDARESFFCSPRAPMIGHVNDTYSAELKKPSEYRKNYPDWLMRWMYYSLVHALESRRLRRLRFIVANSRFTAEMITKTYPNTAGKVRQCYKSVDIARYREVREARLTANPDPIHPVILFVGSNMHRKGVPDLVRAVPDVINEHPLAKFVVVGSDTSMDRIMTLCDELGVSRNVEFVGWKSQADLLELYRQAAVFVMPSLTEALGVTFLESMAAGVPVIGTNVGGIPEIIQDGINGLLVPVESPNSIAKAINRLLSDQELSGRLVRNATAALDRFDVSKMMECTFRLYSKVMEEQSINPDV